ncbi:MAG: RNA polymerase sigma factor [Azospirillaceae bacterium]
MRDEMIALLPRLRRFARGLAGSAADADDLVQATCERALGALDGFDPATRLDSWMFRIMQNQWIDAGRARARRPSVPVDAAGELADATAERAAGARLELDAVRRLVDGLPDDQRAVLCLVAIDGRSYREAAAILDIPVGTVMSRLARARGRLADALTGGEEVSR